MKRFTYFLFLFCCLSLVCLSLAWAGSWPKIEAALSSWEGPRQVTLRTDLRDPLSSTQVQDLLELLLERGFTVIPAPPESRVSEGLILDLRTAGAGSVLALSRAADGAILAFERQQAEKVSPAAKPLEPAPVPQPAREVAAAGREAFAPGPLELSGRPKRLALLGAAEEGTFDIALLYDDVLEKIRVSAGGAAPLGEWRPQVASSRALHVDTGDLDGDGALEIAAVWAEDLRGIYQGTDSKIHTWVFQVEDEKLYPSGTDLEGYLRIAGGKGVVQKRGTYSPFAGPVLPLVREEEGYRTGAQPILWAGRNLYEATPLSTEEALALNERGNLMLVSLATGKALPGGVLLEDLGAFAGPEVAVRLESPEYRSGFEKEDRIKETYHPLPRRMLVGSDGTAYTVARGRSEGLPLVGRPSGSDALVRVVRNGRSLRLERPFAGVDAFILDFALLERPGHPVAAVLLLNEKEDGSGKAYLLFQEGP